MSIKSILRALLDGLLWLIGSSRPPYELEKILIELEADLSRAFQSDIIRTHSTDSVELRYVIDDGSSKLGERLLFRIFYAQEGKVPIAQSNVTDVVSYLSSALDKYAKALKMDRYELDGKVVYVIDSENAAT